MKKHPFKDMTPKKFSPLRTFLSNLQERIMRKSTPFKKMHKNCAEVQQCREYDIQGIFVK